MRVYLGSDHAGFELKRHLIEWLRAQGHEAVDVGAPAYDAADDYPPFVLRAAQRVADDPGSFGIVLGGSGNGEAIAANKVPGVRAALVWNDEIATLAREHNDANVISLGARMHSHDQATAFVALFLCTPFSGEERHFRRIAMMADYETTGTLPTRGIWRWRGDGVLHNRRMRSAGEVLVQLARQYAFRDLAAVAAAGALDAGSRELAEVSLLCSFGQRLLDLDAEDFGIRETSGDEVADATAIPRELRSRSRAARMPQTAKEDPRGALESLRPAYALLLEAMEVRWRRRELAAVVSTAHIISEYLPLLAWEPVLGHAGDPLRIHDAVTGDGSLWGSDDPACPHNGPQRAAAARSLNITGADAPRWRKYLDRRHSHIAGALGVCAAECHDPCSVITRLGSERNGLRERCRLAAAYTDSPLVRLRHAAPVGHGFGVPSTDEVMHAWELSRERLAERPLGDAVLKDDGYALPGLPSLISAVADAPVTPDTLIAEVADHLVTTLTHT